MASMHNRSKMHYSVNRRILRSIDVAMLRSFLITLAPTPQHLGVCTSRLLVGRYQVHFSSDNLVNCGCEQYYYGPTE